MSAEDLPAAPPADHPYNDDFFRALGQEDDLGMVVRAHIHVEAILLEVIGLSVARSDELPSLRFEQRVDLAVAVGAIDPTDGPALKALGSLRNAFAHKLNTELTAERVNGVYGALPEREARVVRDLHEENRAPEAPRFEDLRARDRFIAIVIVMRAGLLARIRRRERELGR
jgi:hypothetical protein